MEKALTQLRNNITNVAPSQLHLVDTLAAELRNERALSLQERLNLVERYKTPNVDQQKKVKPLSNTKKFSIEEDSSYSRMNNQSSLNVTSSYDRHENNIKTIRPRSVPRPSRYAS